MALRQTAKDVRRATIYDIAKIDPDRAWEVANRIARTEVERRELNKLAQSFRRASGFGVQP